MSQVLETRRGIGDRAAPSHHRDVRADFPLLHADVSGQPVVWLDNAATTQKPQAVIDRLVRFYTTENANVHRGGHHLGVRATSALEDARAAAARFLGAASPSEIVFVRGTTEALNLVASGWGRAQVRPSDEILVTALEHHSNLLPWQALAFETGARLRIAPIDSRGELDLERFAALLTPRVKLVALTHVSNAFGTVTPLAGVIERAHSVGAVVVADGAQAVPHFAVDVQALDVDFYAFSGHKVFGPTGIGVLYAKTARLDEMYPWQTGGGMVAEFDLFGSTFQPAPHRFEAGTPNVADAAGLATALAYVESLGLDRIEAHDRALTIYAVRRLSEVPGLRHIGEADDKVGVASFVIDGASPHAIGAALDAAGLAVRVGQHCALPALRALGVDAVIRASFAVYNTPDEVDALVDALHAALAQLPGGVA